MKRAIETFTDKKVRKWKNKTNKNKKTYYNVAAEEEEDSGTGPDLPPVENQNNSLKKSLQETKTCSLQCSNVF